MWLAWSGMLAIGQLVVDDAGFDPAAYILANAQYADEMGMDILEIARMQFEGDEQFPILAALRQQLIMNVAAQ